MPPCALFTIQLMFALLHFVCLYALQAVNNVSSLLIKRLQNSVAVSYETPK